MNLNRTEELEMKRDLGRIRKALEDIASGIVPVKPTTQVVVKDGDPFFGKIHMSEAHMANFCDDYKRPDDKLVSLMEECAELQQAASKMYRNREYNPHEDVWYGVTKDNFVEELTHVLIDIRMICHAFNIKPEELQQEIYKKYPDGYNLAAFMADNKPVCYVERRE